MTTPSRPFTTVLDILRVEIDHNAFDAALFSLESVAADLGYGDVRSLPGSVAWIEQLRTTGKRTGLFAAGNRAQAALELAGITDLFDTVTSGPRTVGTIRTAIEDLGSEPSRTIVVAATADGVEAAGEAEAGIVIAVARGLSTPEQLRQAGAHTVVADLMELMRAVT
jgi:beta-phosphoglucomutase-like phosphatase (HAD superfamily)